MIPAQVQEIRELRAWTTDTEIGRVSLARMVEDNKRAFPEYFEGVIVDHFS